MQSSELDLTHLWFHLTWPFTDLFHEVIMFKTSQIQLKKNKDVNNEGVRKLSWDSVLMLNEEVARDLQNLGIEICSGSLTHSEGLKSCPWNFNCKGFEEENWMSFKVSFLKHLKPLRLGGQTTESRWWRATAVSPAALQEKEQKRQGKVTQVTLSKHRSKTSSSLVLKHCSLGKWWKSDERINSKSTQLGGHCTISMLWRTRVLNFFISQLDARHQFQEFWSSADGCHGWNQTQLNWPRWPSQVER